MILIFNYRPWTVQNTDWVLVVPKGTTNQDHHNFLLRKETLYSKNEYFSFISIETTHSLDGIVEKELHACRCCCKFADLSFYSRQLAQGHRLKMSLEIRYLLEK